MAQTVLDKRPKMFMGKDLSGIIPDDEDNDSISLEDVLAEYFKQTGGFIQAPAPESKPANTTIEIHIGGGGKGMFGGMADDCPLVEEKKDKKSIDGLFEELLKD